MNIHEYQAKEIFRKYNVPVPNGGVAYSAEEALSVAKSLDSNIFVVKAQIHAGGRGKAGGVKIAKNLDEVTLYANEILGKTLVTHQTGPAGKTVGRLLVEEGIDIARELYMGIVLDRQTGQFVFMVSVEGGMEIEKVAAETPEKIIKEWIEPGMGLQAFQARKLAYALGLQGVQVREAVKFMFALWNAFDASDASLVEINPLVVTGSGHVMALDAKMNFDDNALYRQADILEYRDLSEEEASEVEASSYNLNYIKLDGNVGCMVNGAGLAMGTMDIIKLYGGEPANFLDVGGVANPDTVSNGFRIIMSDSNVKAVLINIFGGIVRCDRVAMGIILALEKVKVNVPIVVRLAGTNAEEGARLLANSDIDFIVATSLAEAAEKVTAAIKE
ncbi:MAG: ADP-forming succinate--CoA ligase subunit beta [Candidatus Marinimicrobia bacterium]|jgi:succinyl-CoA synthetase beta subunit|nr:ADP-forming succinate--CoA ligase subunit beta [Candidatus Neomarinimicrobiota bacterium]MBT4714661.1 ADP-forming succinate--CoA ligase subunit beta [Candidatus Neomarinimicrobiota bacterium]MBT4945349.1 ADP-forming succinate--CoA ligase subunit beta [Candidatus Neomarinimicrobiota bacterium]MBT5270849.1 ADP-forming succinate--CoA ligase subunit beta [Candidatus Neomarinimicrobiota bacterium]MBT6012695.1 ADP-forming succinate--CoA ligase subunit beta [Candidatus Neomarinimicrobiota bacterium